MARILLAEADPAVRMALGAMLAREQHEVVLATSPLQLASVLSTEPCDIALIDLAMVRSEAVEARLGRMVVIGIGPSDPAAVEPSIRLVSRLLRPLDVEGARVFVAAALETMDLREHGAEVLEGPEGIRVRPSTNEAHVRGQPLRLSRLERRLLTLLLRRRGETLTINALAREVWGQSARGERNFVEARISALRRKMRALGAFDVIETVRRRGYRVPAADPPARRTSAPPPGRGNGG